jgi:hypothetical protein
VSYPAVPDRRMAYDNDGTVVAIGDLTAGVTSYPTGANVIALNSVPVEAGGGYGGTLAPNGATWFFFPEKREITNCWVYIGQTAFAGIHGSNDTTNGMDGTWETASFPAGLPSYAVDFDWRSGIKAVSFTGTKKTIRLFTAAPNARTWFIVHLYGRKDATVTPHDLVFNDQDETPGVEFTSVEDFGDRPLGTTVTRQWRLKNVSATRTAANINIQCNDNDFAISTDGISWVTTINIASLAPGAESGTLWTRDTTPAPGALLGPRFARIVVVAEQDGIPGSNFFA